jgi:hypothetical protein
MEVERADRSGEVHHTPAPDTIKRVKLWAVQHERKDYEVVQDALDKFFIDMGLE